MHRDNLTRRTTIAILVALVLPATASAQLIPAEVNALIDDVLPASEGATLTNIQIIGYKWEGNTELGAEELFISFTYGATTHDSSLRHDDGDTSATGAFDINIAIDTSKGTGTIHLKEEDLSWHDTLDLGSSCLASLEFDYTNEQFKVNGGSWLAEGTKRTVNGAGGGNCPDAGLYEFTVRFV